MIPHIGYEGRNGPVRSGTDRRRPPTDHHTADPDDCPGPALDSVVYLSWGQIPESLRAEIIPYLQRDPRWRDDLRPGRLLHRILVLDRFNEQRFVELEHIKIAHL
jgi:hypothetical protein